MTSCFVGLSMQIKTLHMELPATVTIIPGISRQLGQERFGSTSDSTGTVPLKGKLTVLTRNSILDPLSFQE